jgi:hypothetical protein
VLAVAVDYVMGKPVPEGALEDLVSPTLDMVRFASARYIICALNVVGYFVGYHAFVVLLAPDGLYRRCY